jgi:hypothetical protein
MLPITKKLVTNSNCRFTFLLYYLKLLETFAKLEKCICHAYIGPTQNQIHLSPSCDAKMSLG